MASKEGRADREREKVKVSDRAGILESSVHNLQGKRGGWASIVVPAWSVLHG